MFLDPFQMWRDALTRLESDVNAALTSNAKSQDVVRSLHQFSSTALGIQRLIERLIEAYLRRANLPSRKEVAELAESLRRMEDKLDRLLPAPAVSAPPPRPARTRRPPLAAGESAPTPQSTPPPESAPLSESARRPAPAPGGTRNRRRTAARRS